MSGTDVCVIIAAHNAADTIGTAIASALREPEVVEVIVVDDASTDATEAVAHASEDGSGRLMVLRLDVNRGPSFARNMAIRHSTSPLIAILDADDFFLPGRFGPLVLASDWDIVADNLVFVRDPRALGSKLPSFAAEPASLDLASFVEGNISRRGAQRGELGFLKPIIRRDFLDEHGLAYDENLRLGEDYALYAWALLLGARFRLVRTCGYAAVVRPNSLSGRHSTDDLWRLADVDQTLLTLPGLSGDARKALQRHERHMRDKYRLRRFLDLKAEVGLVDAATFAFGSQGHFRAVFSGVARDKFEPLLRLSVGRGGEPQVRYLLPGTMLAASTDHAADLGWPPNSKSE
ncbi:glycosyltransferase family 2 protein [Aminobacter sp. MET-1]|uniref:glycosyltransferase family 2 protein n=1 Tax=Aminobacter sp. MET-1 TaxID=2951085 RepID=UPI00226AC18B|nr:glycosyltransferase family 2 protein [Aminobacter sp. MET-1]MCX8572948.1 glycosyltransferase family 2 protein [Aminobacter sp. MET-1]